MSSILPAERVFPESFFWGAATAAYQVEGGAHADGKGDSIWDVFCRREGAIHGGHSGEVACDHYHRSAEDVALMKTMRLQAYRFSLTWSRIQPDGRGEVNSRGLGFYDRLIDQLLEAEIEPWINICHFDLPHRLFLEGGWLHPDVSKWFADFTEVAVEAFSDRVKNWATFNEPNVMVMKGYWNGDHAPGLRLPLDDCLRAAHNILLSHGRAVQVIRAHSKQPAQIGVASAARKCAPISDSAEDIEAARQFQYTPVAGCVQNPAWWLDPMILGSYPADAVEYNGRAMPDFPDTDFELIAQPIDFIGYNCYGGPLIRAGKNGEPEEAASAPGAPKPGLMPFAPSVIYWAMRFHHERYALPLVVMENGMHADDWVSLDGRVHDPNRIDYTTRYLREVHRLIGDGVPVLGYFHWTLMDNFEWAAGYSIRMGLIHIDFATQKRTLKDSALWYADVIRSHGETLWDS
jgi:beta-glucosidase